MNKDTSMFLTIIVMIVLLKLAAVQPFASWSWLWILSPLWITVSIGVILAALKVKLPKS
jgi:hypothetical protein